MTNYDKVRAREKRDWIIEAKIARMLVLVIMILAMAILWGLLCWFLTLMLEPVFPLLAYTKYSLPILGSISTSILVVPGKVFKNRYKGFIKKQKEQFSRFSERLDGFIDDSDDDEDDDDDV